MKAAICISGHLRDGDNLCYPELKRHILDKHDCDIFISSWKENGNMLYSYGADIPYIDEDVRDRILERYKPVKYVFSDSNSEWITPLKEEWAGVVLECKTHVFQFSVQFKKIMDCDVLRREYQKETGVKYDVVLRIRFDIEPTCDILTETESRIKEKKLLCKNGHQGVKDQVFWGEEEIMARAADCFLHFSKYVSKPKPSQFNSEQIFRDYLLGENMPKDEVDFKFQQTKPGHSVPI